MSSGTNAGMRRRPVGTETVPFFFPLLFSFPFFSGNASTWGGGEDDMSHRGTDGIILPAFRLFSFLLLTRNAPLSKSAQICFQGNFPPNVINCSSFCKNRRHRLNSDFLRGRKRIPRTFVSSSFSPFSQNKKSDEERRRGEGFPSSGKPSGKGQGGRKRKGNKKTKTKKNCVSGISPVTLFSLPWTGVFFFPFLKKEGQRERNTSAFFLFFCSERKKKKENALHRTASEEKETIERKAKKKEGDNLHPEKGKREKQ